MALCVRRPKDSGLALTHSLVPLTGLELIKNVTGSGWELSVVL